MYPISWVERQAREREREQKFPWQEKLLEDIFLFSLYRNEHDKYGKWNSSENEFFSCFSLACAQFVHTFVLLLLCDDIERFRMLFLTIDFLWLLRSHCDVYRGVDLFWKNIVLGLFIKKLNIFVKKMIKKTPKK